MSHGSCHHQPPGFANYGCQYRPGNSPVHRLGPGWKLFLGALLGVAAIGAHRPWSLGVVLCLNLAYYFIAGLSFADLWRDTRYLLLQALIILFLYGARYGVPAGLWPGMRIALQIGLFFIPGVVFIRTTRASRMMESLRTIFPYRISFLIYTSMRFVPLLAREMGDIRMAQRLRGARLSFQDLLNPFNWSDAFNCLMIPLLVRALRISDEASLSAQARGFGRAPERTCFDPAALDRDRDGYEYPDNHHAATTRLEIKHD